LHHQHLAYLLGHVSLPRLFCRAGRIACAAVPWRLTQKSLIRRASPQIFSAFVRHRRSRAAVPSRRARACRLRPLAFFRPLSAGEAEFIQQMKSAQIIVAARAKVIEAGEVGGSLYTLYDGWAIRYRMLG